MVGKIFGVLFCGVFAAVGIGIFAFNSVPTIIDWQDAKSWYSVPAQLQSHSLDVNHGDDSTTYKATATYRYEFGGRYYVSNKVGLSSGSDNIGSYHQDMSIRLGRITQHSEPLLVWVNPENPSEAVIDRDMRWGLLLFESIFLFVFGGFGLGGMYLMYRFRNAGEVLATANEAQPWTKYSEWSSNIILSSAKLGGRVMMIFALLWNLISIPAGVLVITPILDGEHLLLLVLIFPVIGLVLARIWYKMHRSYQLTGPMPLTLDPYPGSLGGQVGGIIRLSKRDVRVNNASIVLQCVHTYTSGSGDDRKTRERIIWETSMVPSPSTGMKGPEYRFCFDVEQQLPVSEPPLDMPRNTWRITFNGTAQDGTKIEREYQDLPVFATAQQSSLRDPDTYAKTSFATIEANEQLVKSVLDLKQVVGGYQLYYPAYRNFTMLLLVLFGVIFITIGVLIPDKIFNIVFPLIGGPVALGGAYGFLNSLEVRLGAEGITAQRRILGLKLKPKFVPSYSFKKFKTVRSHSSSSGKKTTQYYNIVAHGKEGERAPVAQGLKGLKEANAAIEKLESVLGYE